MTDNSDSEITPSPAKRQKIVAVAESPFENKDLTSRVPPEVYRAHVFSLLNPLDVTSYATTSKKSGADAKISIHKLQECKLQLEDLAQMVQDQEEDFKDLGKFIKDIFDMECSASFNRVKLILDAIDEHKTFVAGEVYADPTFMSRATLFDWINLVKIHNLDLFNLGGMLLLSGLSTQNKVNFLSFLINEGRFDGIYMDDQDDIYYLSMFRVFPYLQKLSTRDKKKIIDNGKETIQALELLPNDIRNNNEIESARRRLKIFNDEILSITMK